MSTSQWLVGAISPTLMGQWTIRVALALLVASAVGCSSDDDPDPGQNLLANGGNNSSSNANQNGGDGDAGSDADADDSDADLDGGDGEDGDADPDGGDADPDGGDADADGGDADADGGDADPDGGDTDADGGVADADGGDGEFPVIDEFGCGPVVDLGELDYGDTVVEIDFSDFENDLATGCDGTVGGDAGLFKFSAPPGQPVELAVSSEASIASQIRRGGCDGEDILEFSCVAGDLSQSIFPGVEHYLVIDDLDAEQSDSIEVALNLSQMQECEDEEGQTQCTDSGQIEVCRVTTTAADIPQWFTGSCAQGDCQDGACAGDSCANPILVTDSFEWSGQTLGYLNTHDSIEEVIENGEDDATCVVRNEQGDIIDGMNGPGGEMIFEVANGQAGDILQIEIDQIFEETLMVAIKDSCSETASCLDVWIDEEQISYELVESGNLYIIVDSATLVENWVDISIEIQSP